MRSRINWNRWFKYRADRGDKVTASQSMEPGTQVPKYFPFAYKLTLAITVLSIAGIGLLGLVTISNQSKVMRAQMDEFGQTAADQLAEGSKELIMADDTLGLKVMTSNLGGTESILGTAIFSDIGVLLASSGIVPRREITHIYDESRKLDSSNRTVDWDWIDPRGTHQEVVSFISPVRFQNVAAGHVLVTFSRTPLSRSSRDAKRTIIGAILLMSVVVILIAFWMSRRLSRPIDDLMSARSAIESGDYAFRLDERPNDELGLVMEGFNTMAKGLLQKSQVENVLSRYVSSSVANQILANLGSVRLGGEPVLASVLFADIVGFTSLSEKLSPTAVGELLNEYYNFISLASKIYRGNIDKFIGDCAMLTFGVPEPDERHSFHAVACAVMIQRLVERLNVSRAGKGKHTVEFRIGVNCGTMFAGNLGSDERIQYTVVGESVNLASRLAGVAEGGQIVISRNLHRRSDVRRSVVVREYKEVQLRGIKDPVGTYLVEDLPIEYRAFANARINQILAENLVA
jgi:adenylate cyclase